MPIAPIRPQKMHAFSRPHCTTSGLGLGTAAAFQSESPNGKPQRREKYKNITINPSMSLKTKKGVGKRTQNEPKNRAAFERPMRTWSDGADKTQKSVATKLRSYSKQSS